MRKLFTDEVLKEMVGSADVVEEIEKEWEQLVKDRDSLRQIFPQGKKDVSKRERKTTYNQEVIGN